MQRKGVCSTTLNSKTVELSFLQTKHPKLSHPLSIAEEHQPLDQPHVSSLDSLQKIHVLCWGSHNWVQCIIFLGYILSGKGNKNQNHITPKNRFVDENI